MLWRGVVWCGAVRCGVEWSGAGEVAVCCAGEVVVCCAVWNCGAWCGFAKLLWCVACDVLVFGCVVWLGVVTSTRHI